MTHLQSSTQQQLHAAVKAAQTDLLAARNEFLFRPPSCLQLQWQSLLQDQRDLPIFYLLFNVTFTVLPAAIALCALPAWTPLLGPLYLAVAYVLFLERFLLALHYSQHRKLFNSGDLLWYAC